MGANDIIIRIIGQDMLTPALKNAQTSLGNIGSSLSNIGRGLTMGITAPIVGAGTASVLAASNLEESMNKTKVVFGEAAVAVTAFADTAALKLGMSKQQALEATGTFGNLFSTMGIGLTDSANMSQGLVQLASDLASFNNIDPAVALEKLRSGLVGEVEPLRALGINLLASTVQEKALAMGLAETKDELTQAMLAQARYALIMEQTTNAQGDFARTSDGLANSMRIAKAQLGDAAAQLGTILIPVVTKFLNAITPLIQKFTEMSPAGQKTILIIAGIAAAIGPLLMVIGTLISTVSALLPIFGAVAGVLIGPVGLAILAIIALVALLAVAWKNNWGDIQGKFMAAKDAIIAGWQAFTNALKSIWAVFQPAFEGNWRQFGENLRGVWDTAWNNIKEIGINTWNAIKTFFADTDWGQIGKNILQGIADGIVNAVGAVINAAKKAGKAIYDAIAGFFDMKSPSKLMAGMGKNLMQGLAIGISGNQNIPAAAAVGASYSVTKAMTDNRTFNFNYSGNASKQNIFQAYEMARLME